MPLSLAAIGYGSLYVGLSLGLTGSGGTGYSLLVYGLVMPVSHAIVVSLLIYDDLHQGGL